MVGPFRDPRGRETCARDDSLRRAYPMECPVSRATACAAVPWLIASSQRPELSESIAQHRKPVHRERAAAADRRYPQAVNIGLRIHGQFCDCRPVLSREQERESQNEPSDRRKFLVPEFAAIRAASPP